MANGRLSPLGLGEAYYYVDDTAKKESTGKSYAKLENESLEERASAEAGVQF